MQGLSANRPACFKTARMTETVAYSFDPASIQASRIAMAAMVGLIVAASAVAVWRLHWRGLAVAVLAAALVPASTVIVANGFRPMASLWIFVRDQAAPLSASVGATSAVIGALLGVVLRRAMGRMGA